MDPEPDQNEVAKLKLVSLLREKRAILMAGAGSSKFAGFPLWHEFLAELRKLTPSLRIPEEVDLVDQAQLIKDQLRKEDRIAEYYNILERKFEPRAHLKNHDDFHVVLVQLGFCGLVTTNYDRVLEDAATEAYSDETGPFHCDVIDLCAKRTYRVFDFLRELALSKKRPRWVLHLHGYYRTPERIIFSREDYLWFYGEGERAYDEYGKPLINRVLDRLHRKVLWSLFTLHPLVFVGFSLEDEFFRQMLRVVQVDFTLGSDTVHFALLPYTVDEDKEKAASLLRPNGVHPIFYHVPKPRGHGEGRDHTALRNLVYELAQRAGSPTGVSDVILLTKRMLKR